MNINLNQDGFGVTPQYSGVSQDMLHMAENQETLEKATARLITPTLSWLYRCWNIILDLTFGLCGSLLIVLLLPILAVLMRLDSPGSLFYCQERLGYQGKKFTIYKFRSMRVAEAKAAVWTTTDDPRITRLGRFMRATHLDELPQAFNILRREMSLIGPRPEQEMYALELEKADPRYRDRLAIRPGLTGWAQVKYGYGDTSMEELIKLEYDLYYIQFRSCLLDARILLMTVAEVLYHRGK